jgi:hypothetical protein
MVLYATGFQNSRLISELGRGRVLRATGSPHPGEPVAASLLEDFVKDKIEGIFK